MAYKLLTPITEDNIFNTNFFNGRLLSAEDLQTEQTANRNQRRLLGQAVGAGIASGLLVGRIPSASGQTVTVTKGLAVNREGQGLCLPKTIQLQLVPEKEALAAGEGLFTDCLAVTDSVFSGEGVYLLVLAPASTFSIEQAPMQGFGGINGGPRAENCSFRYTREGVQFRFLKVNVSNETIAGEQAATLASMLSSTTLKETSKLRNRLAHVALGTFEKQDFASEPFERVNQVSPQRKYGLLDGMRAMGKLLDCDVPLALIFWTSMGIEFVDMWSARRGSVVEPLSAAWPLPVSQRRRAEAEAQFLQFQEHLAWLENRVPQTEALKAAEFFDFLPPVGLLPGDLAGGGKVPANTFFSGFPLRDLEYLDGAAVQALLTAGMDYGPIDLAEGEMVWLYQTWQNEQASQAPGKGDPAVLFTSAHVPPLWPARYDASRWEFNRYL